MSLSIGIFGAGAIGGYVGVRLSAGGARVTLLGRPSLALLRDALQAEPLGGTTVRPADSLRVVTDPDELADCDVVLVTVKTRATVDTGRTLAGLLAPEALVLSLQNGLHNGEQLAEALGPRALAGMVTFNVLREEGRLRQLTEGPIYAAASEHPRLPALVEAFAAAGEPLHLSADMPGIQAGKLLLNLNNGICAATGLRIADSLATPDLRWCYARCLAEGRRVLRAAGWRDRKVGALPASWIVRLLGLPDALFRLLLGRVITIDPDARSSTLQDLQAGKPTEIGELNGEIVSLAAEHGLRAPANGFIFEQVRKLERAAPPLPFLRPAELRLGIARAIAEAR